MRICYVISGYLPVAKNEEEYKAAGWGAMETVMYQYYKNLKELGHDIDIKWLGDVEEGMYDIVHIHVANLCIEANKRGISYIYSMHDHSSYHAGKDSQNYKIQLEAIKGSIFSICHAQYIIDYFDTDKLFFLTHGTDTSYYKPNQLYRDSFKLLMIANNGLMGDYAYDRKGFLPAIEAAKRLDMPITIVGADANKRFFEIHKEATNYEKLTIINDNPTRDETLKIYQQHAIFLHPSMLEFGFPSLSHVEAKSCGLPIVGTYKGSKVINGMYVIPDINANEIVKGIETVMASYAKYADETQTQLDYFDWFSVCKKLEKMYEIGIRTKDKYDRNRCKEMYSSTLNGITINQFDIDPEIDVVFHSIKGLHAELKSKQNTNKKYDVVFYEEDGHTEIYRTKLGVNMWAKTMREYYTNARLVIKDGERVIYDKYFDDILTGNKVLITIASDALGDNIAWIPYCIEFQRKHKCFVSVHSSKKDFIFNKEINFVDNIDTSDIVAHYEIGWFYDKDKEPETPNLIPLQKAASNILGLKSTNGLSSYDEMRPDIGFEPLERPYIEKYICIATKSTAGLKLWEEYKWDSLREYLKNKGYTVIDVSQEESPVTTMNLIYHSVVFIGLSSGLSWLAWALKKHVIMIAGFTEENHEFSGNRTRILNKDPQICSGCWNSPLPEERFNHTDFDFCPRHKNDERKWECQKSITVEMVIEQFEKMEKINFNPLHYRLQYDSSGKLVFL